MLFEQLEEWISGLPRPSLPLTFRTLFSLDTVSNFSCFLFVAILRPSIILNRPKDLSSYYLCLAFLSFHSFRSESSCFLDNDHKFYRCIIVALVSLLNSRGYPFSHNASGYIKTIYSMAFKTIRFWRADDVHIIGIAYKRTFRLSSQRNPVPLSLIRESYFTLSVCY